VLETKATKKKSQQARWKRAEVWLYKQLEGKLGLKRWGHIRRGTSCPDLVDELFSYDVTTTNNKLAFVENELRDAEQHAAHTTRTALLFIFPNGKQFKEGYVVYRVKDWLDMHGGA